MSRSIRVVTMTLSLALCISAIFPGTPARVAAASGDKRPNLQMLGLHDWRIQTVDGRRLLRFTTIFVNAGRGPFELRGTRTWSGDRTMAMDQVMYRWDGSTRIIDTPAAAKYSGDGHDHWHVQGVVTYEIWREAEPTVTRRGAKTGFCFFDTTDWRLSLRGARQSPYYREEWCGSQTAMTNRVGVSVGWGDRYPWHFAYQWVDITGLPGGIYHVRSTVDIQDFYDESVETDNCVWTRIRIPAPGSMRSPTVYANGSDCGTSAITPVSSFDNGVTWDPPLPVWLASGVHVGYTFNSQGTELRRKRSDLRADRLGTASARAIPPGQTGRWLYMASGPFAGYWLRQGDRVKLQP